MTKDCFFQNEMLEGVKAGWVFGETWFIFDGAGCFLFTIELPRESTISEIKSKYKERIKEWENEK